MKQSDYIYSESLQKIKDLESEYFREFRNDSSILGSAVIDGFDQYAKMHALMKAGFFPTAIFGVVLQHKKKLSFNIRFDITDLGKQLYFSFKDFKWGISSESGPDIIIKAKSSVLTGRSFYIKYFGIIPCVVSIVDLLKGSVKINNKSSFFRLLLWDGSWFKGVFKSILGCDVRLGIQGLTKGALVKFSSRYLGSDNEKILILDAGCGEGETIKAIKERGYETVGIDILSSGLTKTPGFKVLADLLHMPVKSSSFHAVFILEVIEHFDEECGKLLLREISACLKKGGVLVLSTPNPVTPCQRIIRKMERIPDSNSIIWPLHRREYSVSKMKKLIQSCGFQVKKVLGYSDLDVPHTIFLHPIRDHLKSLVRKFPSLSYDYVVIAIKME